MKGHVRRRGRRSWEIVYDAPRKADGRRNQQRLTVQGSKADAEAKLAELLIDTSVLVYAIQGGDAIKVGVATDPNSRMQELQTGNPFPLKLLWTIQRASRRLALDTEYDIHAHYRSGRMEGEWFQYSHTLANLPINWQDVFGESLYHPYWIAKPEPFEPGGSGAFHDIDLQEALEPKLIASQPSYAPDEAAIVLGITEAEVAALIDSGAIPVVRMDTRGFAHLLKGSPVRIRHKDLAAYQNA